jgi:sec-independent protein translocase protein TatA
MPILQTISFLQGQELIIILVLVLLFFGGAKIPQLMRGLGRGVGEFQHGVNDSKKKIDEALRSSAVDDDDDKPAK